MKSTCLLFFILFLYARKSVFAADRFAATVTDDRHNPVVPSRNMNGNPTIRPSARPTRKPSIRKPVTPPMPKPTFAPTNKAKSPTKKPISFPSGVPSKKPNALPTNVPSKKPTAAPNILTMRTPTIKPRAPTKKPITPSGAPIMQSVRVPTKTPSKKSVIFPTAAPMNNPVQQPISNPSIQIKTTMPAYSGATPTSKTCQSQAGNFGQATSNALVVTYNYRMDLATSKPDPVLQSLEVAISDTLVRELISSCSSNTSNFFLSKVTTADTNSSQVLGMVSAPQDKVLSSVKCSSSVSPAATNCFLIEGKLTVYLPTVRQRRHLSSTDVYGKASSAIQGGMSSGTLAQSNTAIVKLTYLNDGTVASIGPNNNTSNASLPTLTGSSNDVPTVTENKKNKDSILTPVAYALIGVFGGVFTLAILALTYFKLRHKNDRQQHDDTESKDPQIIQNETFDDTTIVSSSTIRDASLVTPKYGRYPASYYSDSASVDEDRRRKSRSWG